MSGVQKLQVSNCPGLDLINVIIDDIELGKGRIIIECYGQVWSSFWGAIGNRSISQFFVDCQDDYLFDNLNGIRRPKKHEEKYLLKIIKSVKDALVLWNSFDVSGA